MFNFGNVASISRGIQAVKEGRDPGYSITHPFVPKEFTPTPNNSSQQSQFSASSAYDYNFAEYLEGLFSSVGAEQEVNRIFNAEQAAVNRDFQSREAQIQRDWYESQSNNAYQRATRDLLNSGLNPVLAVSQGGASSSVSGVPAGSNASVSGAQGDTLSSILNALASVASSVADFLPNITKLIKVR